MFFPLHGGNTHFMNADSPSISHKTMTRFSIAQLNFEKHQFLELFLPAWQPTRYKHSCKEQGEKDTLQKNVLPLAMELPNTE